jgi:hypothetical protein
MGRVDHWPTSGRKGGGGLAEEKSATACQTAGAWSSPLL